MDQKIIFNNQQHVTKQNQLNVSQIKVVLLIFSFGYKYFLKKAEKSFAKNKKLSIFAPAK